jgi:predicted Zn-dependent protease
MIPEVLFLSWSYLMASRRALIVCLIVSLAALSSAGVRAEESRPRFDGALPDSDVLMRALADELTRSMEELVLEDLPRPYFIQYTGEDHLRLYMTAAYGGLLRSSDSRYRLIGSRVRVGSSELDNTNFRGSWGARARVPIEDDYTALRHAIWQLTDDDYKRAVEALTRKVAFLKEKTVIDRPDDFSPADVATAIEPSAEVAVDRDEWENRLKELSARFARYPGIQDSEVSLMVGAANQWVVNSEGARLRTGDTGFILDLSADTQAPDGMPLADSRSYLGEGAGDLPPMEKMLAEVDAMCSGLMALTEAPVLEHYDGPVLFEPLAAGKVFQALLAERLCARPIPLGSGGWYDESLEKKIGRRILPRSFQVVDDPGPQRFEGKVLAGSYEYDDEAVRATRVRLVENGILKTLLASRAPTKKIKQTTGHGRGSGYRDPAAQIGCLYISDDKAMSSEALKQALIEAARDEGLEFGLRIASMEEGGGGVLGDPIRAYKVYVEDGREELVRGLEFLSVETRALKHILAAGSERKAYNSVSDMACSIVAPAVLMEELELTKTEREFDKLPILNSPATRGTTD